MTSSEPFKIAIASGKGGTGKTTLSTNLAAFIAEHEEVVLVDLDVEEPNSGLFFNGRLIHEEDNFKMIPQWDESKCTLCGICQKVCNYHAVIRLGPSILVFPELCHSCFACSELCPSDALPMIPKKIGTLTDFHTENLHFIESRLDIGEEQAVPSISINKEIQCRKIWQCPHYHLRLTTGDLLSGNRSYQRCRFCDTYYRTYSFWPARFNTGS